MIAFVILLGAVTLWGLYRYFYKDKAIAPVDHGRIFSKENIALVLIAFCLSRALFLLGGIIFARDNISGYFAEIESKWTRWDANHYVGLIENWYQSEGDPRYHIVFFPLYPFIGRVLRFTTGLSSTVSAYIVSNLTFLGCGFAMLDVAGAYLGKEGGRRAMLLMMFSPMSLFCSIPYTESVFLLTTLLAVSCARREKFGWAVLFGALSANSRMLGMATAIPIFYEMLRAKGAHTVKDYIICILKVLPVSLGLLAYLGLNRAVTGEWFKFMEYQSEHWSQSFGSLLNTYEYTLENALHYENEMYRAWLWLPQLVTMAAALAVIVISFRSAHSADLAYSVVYYYVSLSPTWLLSGMRYLGAMYPIYTMLAGIKNKYVYAAFLLVFAFLCVVTGGGYSVHGIIL